VPIIAGKRLGPYEILSAVGAGGMGEVYRARDTRLDRIVAAKSCRIPSRNRAELRDRFERDAQVQPRFTYGERTRRLGKELDEDGTVGRPVKVIDVSG
jgi:serine/threonine protein kinase